MAANKDMVSYPECQIGLTVSYWFSIDLPACLPRTQTSSPKAIELLRQRSRLRWSSWEDILEPQLSIANPELLTASWLQTPVGDKTVIGYRILLPTPVEHKRYLPTLSTLRQM
jgi:hypothetical protein